MSRLVFDIGGTNMRLALSEEGVLAEALKRATPKDAQEAVVMMREFAAKNDIQDIVGGVAGIVEDGTVMDSPNLPSWNGFPLAEAVREAFSAPVQVYNDAALAGIGEALAGAGQGYARVGYLTIGTGVGGTLVTNDGSGAHVTASEPGRLILETGRTLESAVGGAALAAEFGTRPELLPQSVYDERTPVLVAGIRLLLDLWMPDILILNGPLAYGTPAFRIGAVTEELARTGSDTVPVVLAAFKDHSGLQGGALIGVR